MSALRAGPAAAPGRRSGKGFGRLVQTEFRLLMREPMLVFWAVIFPIGLLVVIGSTTSSKPQKDLGGVPFIVVYTPVMMVFTLTLLAMSAMPATLASYRDKGYLKRLSTTPIGALRLLGAQIVLVLSLAACLVILILLVSHFAFNVPFPSDFAAFVLAVVLTAFAMASLGLLVASLAPTARIAGAVGSILFFPLMFFAGLWIPQAEMGSTLRSISHYTPLGAAVPAIQNAITGHWPGTAHLIVLAVYTVVLCRISVRLFRWER